jgi:hypothetical protein
MPSRRAARLARLEAQAYEGPHRQGIAAVLAWGRRNGLKKEWLPLTALADAELDAKITAVTGPRGLSLLLREALEDERTRRQEAQGKAPPACAEHAPTGGPGEHNRPKPALPQGLCDRHDAMVYVRP